MLQKNVEDDNDNLALGEEVQLKLLQRHCGELCDQMTLCLDVHMQRVYACLCQHFDPAEAVDEPRLKVEQQRQRTVQVRTAVQRRLEREAGEDAKLGSTTAATRRATRALQVQVDLALQALRKAQSQLSAARDELEEERSRSAEYESKRRALRRQRLHRLDVLADNSQSLKAEIKHLRELREMQKEAVAEQQRFSAGSQYSYGDEYVLIRQNQNSLRELDEKQRSLENLLARAEDIVVAGGGSIREGDSSKRAQKIISDGDISSPAATAQRIHALDSRSRYLREDKGWVDPMTLAFGQDVSQAQPESLIRENASPVGGVDDDEESESLPSHSRISYEMRRREAATDLTGGSLPAAWFTPSLPSHLLRLDDDGPGISTKIRGAHHSSSAKPSGRTKQRHHTPPASVARGARAPPSTPAPRHEKRTPFLYHSHLHVESADAAIRGSVQHLAQDREAQRASRSTPAASALEAAAASAPPSAASLVGIKEAAHSMLRAELIRTLDEAGGARSRASSANSCHPTSTDMRDLQHLLRTRVASFKQ
jgi:hypothetical protein